MSEKTSKFSALLQSRKQEPPGEPEPQVLVEKAHSRPKAPAIGSGAGDVAPRRSRGRPKANGKRLNPDYTQITAYIPADLHTETKINLIRSGKREFSILIEELLTTWNKKLATNQKST